MAEDLKANKVRPLELGAASKAGAAWEMEEVERPADKVGRRLRSKFVGEDGKFDRRAYQAAYMRLWRERRKG